ncbi:hypothetical protein LOTGIDRAFT_127711 [Lottia gigantea]|uniref:DNA-(apurinic or apyrimidinic site) lyase n=1 Tax=Lottia gigantea TaxID=225164 RepID=V4A2J5_LOTGI|nr:hypothetical protein LOTGIDRAFT_127711 [Lottia gigantea]ESO87521.1 hypothetical protein LOTGIDRAFT_127711 [Lottia gigantea]
MPEGPELNLSAKYVNTVCKNKTFRGSVVKSVENAKNPEINWNECHYSIYAESRGKELRLTLSTVDQSKPTKLKELKIVFNFGMSGRFNYCEESEMVKHSHLTFFTSDSPPMILSFVDVRRFGRWRVDDNWAPDRGPCVMLEYPSFREYVLENLDKTAFNKPICEVLLNQSYFNGVGNYLRAEILYRAGIRPFDKARDVLQELLDDHGSVTQKLKKQSKADILQLCSQLCHEVINLGATIYNPVPDADYSKFTEWLQCFYKDGMLNMVDHNKRTIWYSGDPGPMVPKGMLRSFITCYVVSWY